MDEYNRTVPSVRKRLRAGALAVSGFGAVALGSTASASPPPHRGTGLETETLVEFHFTPVADTQVAIWLEDGQGNHVRDVFVTQAVGKLGIGNRSGVWNFLSSWRAPYGPRRSVLPVWAHKSGVTYPEIIFADPNESHATSLGFHEGTSSTESYHCRPLTPNEQDAILDTMTCPSPSTFRTDKGRFNPNGNTSVYPPRNDIIAWDDTRDHEDVRAYDGLNDLDAITGATPVGHVATFQTLRLTQDESSLPTMSAFIEVSKENDQNDDWRFDREADHFVDPLLSAYGVPWLGQPSVVYRVDIDPRVRGLWLTTDYTR